MAPGFLGGYYKVLAFTNFGGAFIPARFQLVKYHSDDPGNSPVAAKYESRVTQFEKIFLERSLPDISRKPVSVSDFRFRDDRRSLDSTQYMVTNQWITDTNDPRLMALKAEANVRGRR